MVTMYKKKDRAFFEAYTMLALHNNTRRHKEHRGPAAPSGGLLREDAASRPASLALSW